MGDELDRREKMSDHRGSRDEEEKEILARNKYAPSERGGQVQLPEDRAQEALLQTTQKRGEARQKEEQEGEAAAGTTLAAAQKRQTPCFRD